MFSSSEFRGIRVAGFIDLGFLGFLLLPSSFFILLSAAPPLCGGPPPRQSDVSQQEGGNRVRSTGESHPPLFDPHCGRKGGDYMVLLGVFGRGFYRLWGWPVC